MASERERDSRQAIVVYDGECAVCGAFRRWVERRDRHARLTFVAFQDPRLAAKAPRVDTASAARTLHFVAADGRVHAGARAVFEAVAKLPGLTGITGRVMTWPPISCAAEPFYRLFARHRGKSAWLFRSSGGER